MFGLLLVVLSIEGYGEVYQSPFSSAFAYYGKFIIVEAIVEVFSFY